MNVLHLTLIHLAIKRHTVLGLLPFDEISLLVIVSDHGEHGLGRGHLLGKGRPVAEVLGLVRVSPHFDFFVAARGLRCEWVEGALVGRRRYGFRGPTRQEEPVGFVIRLAEVLHFVEVVQEYFDRRDQVGLGEEMIVAHAVWHVQVAWRLANVEQLLRVAVGHHLVLLAVNNQQRTLELLYLVEVVESLLYDEAKEANPAELRLGRILNAGERRHQKQAVRILLLSQVGAGPGTKAPPQDDDVFLAEADYFGQVLVHDDGIFFDLVFAGIASLVKSVPRVLHRQRMHLELLNHQVEKIEGASDVFGVRVKEKDELVRALFEGDEQTRNVLYLIRISFKLLQALPQ